MIDMLLSVHVPQAALPEEACPDNVPGSASHVPKASHFEGVHNAIVRVCALRYLEARSAVRLKLLLIILDDS